MSRINSVIQTFRSRARIAGCAAAVLAAAAAGAQNPAPGPYEYLPFETAYIIEAFVDLLGSTNGQIADWTGWYATSWESPNAYDNHGGTDFAMSTGTPVYAATTGTVTSVVNSIPENSHTTYYGNNVLITADGLSPRGEQLTIRVAHLLPNVQVSVGQHVNAGQLIGYSDNTGNSTSEHAHVESALVSGGAIRCPFYYGHYKYPIMFTPNGSVQVGHVVRVKAASTPIRTDRFDSSPVVTTAHQGQLYFASFAKRGYWRIFIPYSAASPDTSSYRSAWIKAVDVEEVYDGTVIQTLPDAGAYVHSAQLASRYSIRANPSDGAVEIGKLNWGGGRFVADQQASGGWYRIPVPGPTKTYGWVKADSNLLVYPELHHPDLKLGSRPAGGFPYVNSFTTAGPLQWGRPKFDRCEVKPFSPASPGGDGLAFFLTDSINTGNAAYDTVSVGRPEHRDYYVEADVYFNYRPSYGLYERYGIFLRDDGFGGFDSTFEGRGNCYAMMWDTDDGRLRCCKVVNATMSDFFPSAQYVKSSGWHRMRIEAEGDVIRYYLNGVLQVEVTDTTFPSGLCGMGYTSHIGSSYPPARGAWFDNFRADTLVPAAAEEWSLYE